MKRVYLLTQTVKKMSPVFAGEKLLLTFAGIFLLSLSAICHFSPAFTDNCAADVIQLVQTQELSDAPLHSVPLRPAEQLVRLVRQNSFCRMVKFRSADAHFTAAVIFQGFFSRNCCERIVSGDFLRTVVCTSIFVRAGPVFCGEKSSDNIAMPFLHGRKMYNSSSKEQYYERFFQKKYGICHLLRFLCNSRDCRNLCLQGAFLRSLC